MTGTDPDQGKQGSGKQRSFDSTQPYRPPEAQNAPPLPPNLPKIPGITLAYEIARGGMGVVYSGRQDFLDRRVAVKLLSVELGGEAFVQRFQREAKILAGIKHPNIVGCYMAGTTDDGQSYLVMEFIDGPSLKKWITDHGPISVTAALRLTRAAAQALAHAYSLGIIHRDVKPENILLETVTSTALDVSFPFTPKVVDLGLARASSGNASMGLTSPGSVMGTPATMSPEQYDDPDAVDFRTDIYGLGCALYEMLVGVPAFRAKKLTEIVAQKRRPIAPDPCGENPALPAAVGGLVQDMLAMQREDRPSSYKDLDERLSALLDATAALARATKVKPPVLDEGATIVSKPSPTGAPAAKPNPFFDEQPASKASQPPQSPPPAAKTGGPGLLRTAEINFLAEGLGDAQPGAPEAPAFQSSIRAGGSAPPQQATSGSPFSSGAQPQPTAPLTVPPVAPAPIDKKKLMLIGGTIALVAAVGIGVAMSGGGKTNGGGGGGGDPKPPAGSNREPRVVSLSASAEKISLHDSFKLVADAKDDDGDGLMYAWDWPVELVSLRGRANQPEVHFNLDDGLPGLEFEVNVIVDDGKGHTVRQAKKLVVDSCPVVQPLIGFSSTGAWKIDELDRRWVEVDAPGDRHVSCRAGRKLRMMSTSLGSESYWEWFGTLESRVDDGTPYAKVGVRFDFGDAGWAVMCSRTGPDAPGAPDDAPSVWTIELMEEVPGSDGQLRSLVPRVAAQWSEPDTTDEYRGLFSVQRREGKLIFSLGESRTPAGGSEVPTPKCTHTVTLPANAQSGTLTLFVDQGIGRFRLKSR